MLKISNLNKYFYRHKDNEIHVINDTTIEFPTTGLVAILGESGSGKTTLMNVIGGLDSFDSGSITYDDYVINKFNAQKIDKIRNEKVGYIFQNYLLLQNRTVKYNLVLSLGMYDLAEEEINNRIDYVLNAIGMLKYKNKLVSELSGGQQQRIAIARALIKTPKLILADEPTGNLDEKNTIQIMNIIKKISQDTLVILISHEKNIAQSYADMIIEVVDGKVVSEKSQNDSVLFHRLDEQAIYLQDYDQKTLSSDNVNVTLYSNDQMNIDIKVIFNNGKYYLSSNSPLVYVTDESEITIKDEHSQDLNIEEDLKNNDYTLETLKVKKSLKLPFKERWLLAKTNLLQNKKRRFFLNFALIIIVVLVLLCLQSIIMAQKIDIQGTAVSDSHLYDLKIEKKDPLILDEEYENEIGMFYDDLFKNISGITPILTTSIEMTYTFERFSQIQAVSYKLSGFSFVPLDMISEEDLYLGRMPENINEIVVDAWVLEKSLSDSTISNVMGIRNFINQYINIKALNRNVKIVGITKNEEHSIYVNKWLMLEIYPSEMTRTVMSVISISEFNKLVGETRIESIDDGVVIVNEQLSSCRNALRKGYILINNDVKLRYIPKGGIDFGDVPHCIVVSDNLYEEILRSVIVDYHESMTIYCENENNENEIAQYIDENSEKYNLNIFYESKYKNRIEPLEKEANKLVTSRVLIVITIILVSFIIIFFTMRSYAIKNIYDIGVYRAIGISRGSIIQVFGIEIFLISLGSTLLGGILCYIVTNVISSMPILTINISVSLSLTLITTAILIVLNVLIGILPIAIYMRMTPSQILSKYDI